jgi:uncharacterized protein YdeI (YjbR/CyaY-like superfamily)
MKPRFFKSGPDFRRWLEKNHDTATELVVGFHKKWSGKGGITYRQALDEALSYGWIDGVRKRVDESDYTTRFTPRKKGSTWSMVNIKRARELSAEGRMAPPGLAAFEQRDEVKARLYAHEQENSVLDRGLERRFRANKRAWAYFGLQPPGYRRTARWWVMSAKKEETRLRRLAALIDCSHRETRVPQLAPTPSARRAER